MRTGVIDTGVAGAVLIVNRPVADHAVGAVVVGDDMPWCDRTRQYFEPEVSVRILNSGFVSWTPSGASLSENVGLEEICTSYPEDCGLTTCSHFSENGSVSVGLLTGEVSTGGFGTGLL